MILYVAALDHSDVLYRGLDDISDSLIALECEDAPCLP